MGGGREGYEGRSTGKKTYLFGTNGALKIFSLTLLDKSLIKYVCASSKILYHLAQDVNKLCSVSRKLAVCSNLSSNCRIGVVP